MTYLVTGGAGFIGSHIVDKLLENNNHVIVLDDFSSGKEENLAAHKNNPDLTIYKMSICDDIDAIFEKDKIDAVCHLAAIPRVQYSIKYPRETHEANINGMLNVLNTCKRHGVKRFVFSSSSSLYGDQEILPLKENMMPNPMSPYALHKLVGEHYCRMYNFLYDMETIALRYFNVFGPRQNPEGDYACLIPKFISKISQGETPTINGDGKQTRDFTYVENVVNANILASMTKNSTCFGNHFNVGGGDNHSVNEVAELIVKLSGRDIRPEHGPAVIEPHDTLADVSKTKEHLEWAPTVTFKEGMEKTWNFFTEAL